ncbi:MAG: hypothetical protein JWO69_261 [Thermoleophilia bacterium]|jgi:hypothetical protein|nr:hypothetical protein [Thermoleophilia bacterium]
MISPIKPAPKPAPGIDLQAATPGPRYEPVRGTTTVKPGGGWTIERRAEVPNPNAYKGYAAIDDGQGPSSAYNWFDAGTPSQSPSARGTEKLSGTSMSYYWNEAVDGPAPGRNLSVDELKAAVLDALNGSKSIGTHIGAPNDVTPEPPGTPRLPWTSMGSMWLDLLGSDLQASTRTYGQDRKLDAIPFPVTQPPVPPASTVPEPTPKYV